MQPCEARPEARPAHPALRVELRQVRDHGRDGHVVRHEEAGGHVREALRIASHRIGGGVFLMMCTPIRGVFHHVQLDQVCFS